MVLEPFVQKMTAFNHFTADIQKIFSKTFVNHHHGLLGYPSSADIELYNLKKQETSWERRLCIVFYLKPNSIVYNCY
jgi:hypothetical protein